MEEKHLSAVHDDADLLLCDPHGVLGLLDGAGEQLFLDAGVEGNYVKFEECLLWLRLVGRERINGRAGVFPLVGERGGPDGGVDLVQDGFADGPNAVLGGVNQPALNSAGEGVLVDFYSNKSFVFCWYVSPIVEVVYLYIYLFVYLSTLPKIRGGGKLRDFV